MADLDAAVFQDAVKSGSSSTSSRHLYGGGVYLNADNKERFYLGATFLTGGAGAQETAGTTTFSHQDVVLGFKWFLDKQKVFMVSAGYGVLCKATYKDPASANVESWNGNSVYAKVSVAPEIRGRWNVGLSLIYYRATFVEKEIANVVSRVNSTTSTVVPGLALSYRW